MQSSYAATAQQRLEHVSALHLSRDLAAVMLFSLLGLTLSAAWISYLGGADTIGAILAQLG
jgi:hypothetical protein